MHTIDYYTYTAVKRALGWIQLPLQLLQSNKDSCTGIKNDDCNAAAAFKPEIT